MSKKFKLSSLESIFLMRYPELLQGVVEDKQRADTEPEMYYTNDVLEFSIRRDFNIMDFILEGRSNIKNEDLQDLLGDQFEKVLDQFKESKGHPKSVTEDKSKEIVDIHKEKILSPITYTDLIVDTPTQQMIDERIFSSNILFGNNVKFSLDKESGKIVAKETNINYYQIQSARSIIRPHYDSSETEISEAERKNFFLDPKSKPDAIIFKGGFGINNDIRLAEPPHYNDIRDPEAFFDLLRDLLLRTDLKGQDDFEIPYFYSVGNSVFEALKILVIKDVKYKNLSNQFFEDYEKAKNIEDQKKVINLIRVDIPYPHVVGLLCPRIFLKGEFVNIEVKVKREGILAAYDRNLHMGMLQAKVVSKFPEYDPDILLSDYISLLMFFGDSQDSRPSEVEKMSVDINFIFEFGANRTILFEAYGRALYLKGLEAKKSSWFQIWNQIGKNFVYPGMEYYVDKTDDLSTTILAEYLHSSYAYWRWRIRRPLTDAQANLKLAKVITIVDRRGFDMNTINNIWQSFPEVERSQYGAVGTAMNNKLKKKFKNI